MCKSNEGDENGCVKEAERKISFFFTSPLPLMLLMSHINRLIGSGDGDVTNRPIKILEKC